MIRLLYISTARVPITPVLRADVLNASRHNNAACEVSGLLIVGRRRFLQALEGPEAAVQTTFDRIARDPRHFALVVLRRERIDQRQFPRWAMGLQSGGAPDRAATIDQAVAALIAPIREASLKGYFTGFTERQAAA